MTDIKVYDLKSIAPMTREEFFKIKQTFLARGVAQHELAVAQLVQTVDICFQELVQAGILEGVGVEQGNINQQPNTQEGEDNGTPKPTA